jgi:hypothetical protein
MKEKQNCTAYCKEQGHILVNMFNDNQYEIHNKETALQLAQSILSAVEEAWTKHQNENEFTNNNVTYITCESEIHDTCSGCCFYANDSCSNPVDIECYFDFRKDKRDIIWKIKE